MYQTYHVAAFSKNQTGGNPAGVVVHAESLSREERQALAAQYNFSETAFVERGGGADYAIEFYTPNKQIDLCGHATVAAFSLLRTDFGLPTGTYTYKSTLGIERVAVGQHDVGLWQKARLLPEDVTDTALSQAALRAFGIDTRAALFTASTGSKFLYIELDSPEALLRLVPDFTAIERLSEQENLVGVYLYAQTSEMIYARMFAPRYGIKEEAATGMAAGALALKLARDKPQLKTWHITQIVPQSAYQEHETAGTIKVRYVNEQEILVSGEAYRLGS
jgi:PhzF family phenazine biosynthesis protein